MDDIVRQALAKWPNVPHCYGWLALDARGRWYMRDDRVQSAGPFPVSKGSWLRHEKLVDFIGHLQDKPPLQAPGTAVFLTGHRAWVPQALLHNVEHNHVLHERNVVLTVDSLDRPRADGGERSDVEELEHGFWRVTLRFGFAEHIDVPARLRQLKLDPALEADKVVWFLGHDKVSVEGDQSYRIARWRAAHPDWPVIEAAQSGTSARMIQVPDVRVAGIQVGPVWFTERPDRNFTVGMSGDMSGPVEGALGGNAYRDLSMTVDYPNGRAAFFKLR